jgi:hypothetical protein
MRTALIVVARVLTTRLAAVPAVAQPRLLNPLRPGDPGTLGVR